MPASALLVPARALLGGLLLLVALAAPAWAHGIFLELREEAPGQVVGEVYFSDGSPPGAGSWSAFRDPEQRPFARGELEAGGVLRFRVDSPGPVRVVVEEPGLHRCQARLVVQEGASSIPTSATPAASPSRAPLAGSHPPRGGVPWTRLLLGLGVIATLGGGLTLWQRRAAPPSQ